MKQYKTYLFDWDGTLATSLTQWLEAWRRTCLDYNLDLYHPEKTMDEMFGNWKVNKGLSGVNLSEFTETMYQYFIKQLDVIHLYPEVIEVLSYLQKSNATIAVTTSSKKSVVGPLIETLKISSYIDQIFGAEDIKNHKPDPEVLLLAIERLSADPQTTVFIGDSSSDIEAGHNAGIDVVAYFPPANTIAHKEIDLQSLKPTYLISSLKELMCE